MNYEEQHGSPKNDQEQHGSPKNDKEHDKKLYEMLTNCSN
jgi:hypothetical protein